MKLEIEDEFCPYRVWVGNILENYGGRLQLRYDTPNPEEPSFWLFYTSRRIHPYGWTKSQGEKLATHYQVDLTGTPDQVRLSGLPDSSCSSGRNLARVAVIKLVIDGCILVPNFCLFPKVQSSMNQVFFSQEV
jgi:mbt repeat.